jgi:hypothetical protein
MKFKEDLACHVEKGAESGSLLRGFSRLFGVKADIIAADVWRARSCFADPKDSLPLASNASLMSGYSRKVI